MEEGESTPTLSSASSLFAFSAWKGGGVKNRPRPDLCFPLCSSFRYGVSAVEFVQPSDWKERLGVDRVIHLVVPDYSAPPGPSMQEGGWAEALPQGGSSGSGPRGKSG